MLRRTMALALVLIMMAVPALADTRTSMLLMEAVLTQTIRESGAGLFDAERSGVYEGDEGEVFVTLYTVLPYLLFTVDPENANEFMLGLWEIYYMIHGELSDAQLILVVQGDSGVYLMTEGETVWDSVLETVVHWGRTLI